MWYTPLKKVKQWRRDQKVYFQYVSEIVTIIKGSKEKQPQIEMDKQKIVRNRYKLREIKITMICQFLTIKLTNKLINR